jgi:hypothetical protein
MLPPRQQRIQDYPEILDRHTAVTPKKWGSKKPGRFLFLVNKRSVLSGLTEKLTSSHHVSTEWRSHCMNHEIF